VEAVLRRTDVGLAVAAVFVAAGASGVVLVFGLWTLPILVWAGFVLLAVTDIRKAALVVVFLTPLRGYLIIGFGSFNFSVLFFMYVVLFVRLAMGTVLGREPRLKVFPLKWIFIVLTGACLVSILPSRYPLLSLKESLQVCYFTLIFVVLANTLDSKRLARTALIVFVISSVVFLAVGFVGVIAGRDLIPRLYYNTASAAVELKDTVIHERITLLGGVVTRQYFEFIPLGCIPGFVAFVAIGFLAALRHHPVARIGLWVSLALALFFWATSYSRTAMAALPLVAVVYLFLRKRASLAAVGLLVVFIGLVLFYPPFKYRFREGFMFEYQPTTLQRVVGWLKGLQMVRDKPITGYGAGTYGIEATGIVDFPLRAALGARVGNYPAPAGHDPHNQWIRFFAETGLAGGIAYLLFTLAVPMVLWKARKAQLRRDPVTASLLAAVFCGVLYVLLRSLTNPFFENESTWIYFSLAYVLAVSSYPRQDDEAVLVGDAAA